MTELRDGMMFEMIVGGCGECRQQFERSKTQPGNMVDSTDATSSSALVRDAAGVVVRDHTAAAVWQ